MKNTVKSFIAHNSEKNIATYRREQSFNGSWSLIDLDDGSCPVDVRFYGNGSVSYCCVWVNGTGYSSRGMAKAGGYGYHKDSAAMQMAFADAGWQFEEHFAGVGQEGMRAALEAVAA